jgi:hypothetical protein
MNIPIFRLRNLRSTTYLLLLKSQQANVKNRYSYSLCLVLLKDGQTNILDAEESQHLIHN